MAIGAFADNVKHLGKTDAWSAPWSTASAAGQMVAGATMLAGVVDLDARTALGTHFKAGDIGLTVKSPTTSQLTKPALRA